MEGLHNGDGWMHCGAGSCDTAGRLFVQIKGRLGQIMTAMLTLEGRPTLLLHGRSMAGVLRAVEGWQVGGVARNLGSSHESHTHVSES